MNREQVMEQLQPVTGLRVQTVQHGPRTRFQVTPEAVIFNPGDRSRALTVSEEGAKSMAAFAGVPEMLGRNLSPVTFAHVMEEMLGHKGQYSLLVRDGQLVEVVKPGQYRDINPERVLTTVERAIGEGVDFHRVTILNNSAYLEIVGVEERAVSPGDMVRAGAMIAFSPINIIRPQVQSYVSRLICTNGATSNYVMDSFTGGESGGNAGSDELWGWLRTSVRKAYRSLDRVVNRWRELQGESISPADRAASIEALIKEMRLDNMSAEAMRARALEEPPTNAYDLHQLGTWATSHVVEDPRGRIRALNGSAQFIHADTHRRICPVCRRSNG